MYLLISESTVRFGFFALLHQQKLVDAVAEEILFQSSMSALQLNAAGTLRLEPLAIRSRISRSNSSWLTISPLTFATI